MTNGFVAGITHLARHPSLPQRDLSSMRRGNLYPIMAPDVRPADPELRHTMLGMTETGSVITISADESDQPEHRRGSFGRPAPGFDTKIVDPDTGTRVDVGEVGELCVRGPYLMQRYYKRSREECFDADGWFHTGDLVAHRRRRLRVLHRPSRRDDQDRGRQRRARRGGEGDRQGHRRNGGARRRLARPGARATGGRRHRGGGRRRLRRGCPARASQGRAVRVQDSAAFRRAAAVRRFP